MNIDYTLICLPLNNDSCKVTALSTDSFSVNSTYANLKYRRLYKHLNTLLQTGKSYRRHNKYTIHAWVCQKMKTKQYKQ